MAPPLTEVADIQLQLTTHLSTPKGWKAELAWLLTYSGRFIHISDHPSPSATGRAQDSESSPAKDRRSTTVPRNQRLAHETTAIWDAVLTTSEVSRRICEKNHKVTIVVAGARTLGYHTPLRYSFYLLLTNARRSA